MSQKSHSPAALDRQLEKVEQKMTWVFAAASAVFVSIILSSFASWVDKRAQPKTSPSQVTAPAHVQASESPAPKPSPKTPQGS
jgi:hypothetical protein